MRRCWRKVERLGLCATVAAGWFAIGMPAQAAEATPEPATCMDGRAAALRAGGYSGPVICEGEFASFRFVGMARGSRTNYLVYDYRYRFGFEGSTVLHGGQRLVILDAQGRYLGQYALTPPPVLGVAVHASAITVDVSGADQGTIDVKDGPPVVAMLDGESVRFFK